MTVWGMTIHRLFDDKVRPYILIDVKTNSEKSSCAKKLFLYGSSLSMLSHMNYIHIHFDINPLSWLCKYQNCTLTLLSDMFTFSLATICCSQGLNFTLFSSNLNESKRHHFECWFTLIAAISCFKVRSFVQLTDS